jgi:hypothetical protein
MADKDGAVRGEGDRADVRDLRNDAYGAVLLTRRLCDEARRRYSVRDLPKDLAELLRDMIVTSEAFRRQADDAMDTLMSWR